jgi:hypothetical protein
VGGAPTKVFVVLSEDQRGGWDADGAIWSNDAQTRDFALATCPDNLLTLLASDMREGLPEPAQAMLQPHLPKWAAEAGDPRALTVPQRYGLAIHAYKTLEADPWFLGRLLLQGGWSVRGQAVGVWSGLDGPVAAKRIAEAGLAEIATGAPPERERVIRLNLARLALRSGDPALHAQQIAALRARTDLSEAQRQQLDALAKAPAAERPWQEGALSTFDALLRSVPATDPRRATARYLQGELQHRLGRPAEARVAWEAVRDEVGASEALRALARFRLDEASGKKPWSNQAFNLTLPPELSALPLR